MGSSWQVENPTTDVGVNSAGYTCESELSSGRSGFWKDKALSQLGSLFSADGDLDLQAVPQYFALSEVAKLEQVGTLLNGSGNDALLIVEERAANVRWERVQQVFGDP